MSKWESEKIVITIDCGTTHTGIAYIDIRPQDPKPCRLTVVTDWPDQNINNTRVPTLIWYDKARKARAFGASARTPNVRKQASEERWQMAEHFKFSLSPPSALPMPISHHINPDRLYADFFGYVHDHTRKFFSVRNRPGIWENVKAKGGVEFVIACPSEWNLNEREVLRKAAVSGGLVSQKDSERKVHFVREVDTVMKFVMDQYGEIRASGQTGLECIVCDAGGFTVKSMLYTFTRVSPRIELSTKTAISTPAGGLFVNEGARQLFALELSQNGQGKSNLQTMMDQFEEEKKTFHSPQLNEDRSSSKSDSLIQRDKFVQLFEGPIAAIIDDLKKLEHGSHVKVSTGYLNAMTRFDWFGSKWIVLVGGFGQSPFLTQCIEHHFGERAEVISGNAMSVNAVAIGAALWYIARTPQAAEPPTPDMKNKIVELTQTNARQEAELQQTRAQLQSIKERLEEKERDHKEALRRHKEELHNTQELYADLRRVVQVHDSHESKDLVDEFRNLNSSIRDVCDSIGDCIIDCFDPKGTASSLIAKGKLAPLFAPESLIVSETTADIFVVTLLRFHISKTLHRLLVKFHPNLTDDESDPVDRYYQTIRRTEPQQNAARWRAWTYTAVERHSNRSKVKEAAARWAEEFVNDLARDTITPLIHIFDPKHPFKLKTRDTAALTDVGIDAYLWSHKVNTQFFHHDFHPFQFKFDEKFNSHRMQREGAGSTKVKGGKIFACVGLGLQSSIARGPNHIPEEELQLRAPVITADDI